MGQRRNTIKLNKFANFRNTYFQIPTIQIYTSLQQPRHYFFSTQALLDDVCIFLKNSPLKPLLLATTLLLPVCAKILSKYLAALPLKRHQNLLLYSNSCQFISGLVVSMTMSYLLFIFS